MKKPKATSTADLDFRDRIAETSAVSRQRRYQLRHKLAGLCHQCADPAVSSGLCLKHLILQRERRRKSNGYTRRNKSLSYALEGAGAA